MVGTFYARPEPGADPYVRVGSRIGVGQTLCIIEAMKIMNPLDAEIAGTIREIAVEDAPPVEFGQVLFRVDPNGCSGVQLQVGHHGDCQAWRR